MPEIDQLPNTQDVRPIGVNWAIFNDGSAQFGVGSFAIDPSGSALIGGNLALNNDGSIAAPTWGATAAGDGQFNSVSTNADVNAGTSVQAGSNFACNGLNGITGDFVIGAQTFHFEGGILTSVV